MRKEKKRKGKERKGVNLMRSQVLYRAAQARQHDKLCISKQVLVQGHSKDQDQESEADSYLVGGPVVPTISLVSSPLGLR